MSDKDKVKKSGRKFFLFTEEGKEAVQDYMRNMTPQIIMGGIGLVFAVRTTQLNFSSQAILMGIVSLITLLLFIYILMINIVDFTDKITAHIDDQIRSLADYKACENLKDFKVWCQHLMRTLLLTLGNRKILFVEFVLALTLLLIPTIAVFFMSAKTAIDILKSISGG